MISKQFLLDEIKELASTFLYLAASLCILETYKSLILLQVGTFEFAHNYEFAIVEAMLLSKIVMLAQKLPFLAHSRKHSLARAVLFQAVIMTLIVDVGGNLEDMLLPHSAHLAARSGNPFALMVTKQFASLAIFLVLFTFRGLDRLLGPGTLKKLLFQAPDGASGTKTESNKHE